MGAVAGRAGGGAVGVDERMAVVSEGVEVRVALRPDECEDAKFFAAEPAAEGDDASAGVDFEAGAVGPGSVLIPDPDIVGEAGFGEGGSARGIVGFALATPPRANSLIRSTIAGSRLARTLGLTSSFHFWIRSTSSGPFNPSSLANSWTRVDNGDSS